MAKLPHQRALDILVHRCGSWSRVVLANGKSCFVHDVACGYDLGEEVAHVTTNVSPHKEGYDVSFEYGLDVFLTNEIVKIEDVETGAILFETSTA